MDNQFYEEYQDEIIENSDEAVDTSYALIKVFLWMFVGVLISFIVAFFTQKILVNALINENDSILSIYMVLMVVSFIVEFIMCHVINKTVTDETNFSKALIGFLVFSALNGLSFSTIFFLLDVAILYQVLAGVALYFLLLAGVSTLFRKKMTTFWSFAGIGLITLLIASVIVSIYALFILPTFDSLIYNKLYLGVSIFGLIVFTIMTIADVNKMKNIITCDEQNQKGKIILGAFVLYLDFINLLMYIIRIIIIAGKSKKR